MERSGQGLRIGSIETTLEFVEDIVVFVETAEFGAKVFVY